MLSTIFDVVLSGILIGGLYALIGAGFNLQYGISRIMNVAHGEFIMLGAVGAYLLHTVLGISPIVSLPICSAILFLIGLLIHHIAFDRLNRLSVNLEAFEGSSLLCCFGLLFVIQNIVSLSWGGSERSYSFMAEPVDIFGSIFAANRIITLPFAVCFGILLYIFIKYSRPGKAIRAITEDPLAAQLMGVSIKSLQGLCFGLGTLLAGLTGVLISTMFAISPYMGLEYTVIAMIVAVLGGLGNILGSMAGGIILGLVGSVTAYVHTGFTLITYYSIFVILLIIRPQGLFSKIEQEKP